MLPSLRQRRPAFEPLESVRNEIERLFAGFPERILGEAALDRCPVDLWEDDDFVYVEAELPGFKKNELDVAIQEGVLTIDATRKIEEKKGKPHLSERRFAQVQRRLLLPSSVDEAQVEARFHDGILKLKLKKEAGTASHRIEIT